MGGLLVWFAAAAALLAAAWARGASAGAHGRAPDRWPAAATITLAPDRPTVVLFAHPRFPCTHATLSELARALATPSVAAVQPRLEVRLFVPDDGMDPTWAHTALWSRAASIAGAHIDVDAGGREAARFDALTSGLVLAYAPDGRRLYAGGVTSGRGHEGDNAGRDALVAALSAQPTLAEADVYGCAL